MILDILKEIGETQPDEFMLFAEIKRAGIMLTGKREDTFTSFLLEWQEIEGWRKSPIPQIIAHLGKNLERRAGEQSRPARQDDILVG